MFLLKIKDNYKWVFYLFVVFLLLINYFFVLFLEFDIFVRYVVVWQCFLLGKVVFVCFIDLGVSVKEDDLMRVEKGEEKSNLVRLLEMGEKFVQDEDDEGLNMMFDLFNLVEFEIVDSIIV